MQNLINDIEKVIKLYNPLIDQYNNIDLTYVTTNLETIYSIIK